MNSHKKVVKESDLFGQENRKSIKEYYERIFGEINKAYKPSLKEVVKKPSKDRYISLEFMDYDSLTHIQSKIAEAENFLWALNDKIFIMRPKAVQKLLREKP
ncbi:MAG: hypothetical protein COU40_03080 [Candidatus Moranbacteria bacterium CG10_big_fil_rev_8_21_14_0_10_35_21]|nr:MAG: hypothetical protein COU40_03080 [Candidatus Moranbacteria bacterium CG10_big_fil_rev_8_21_14_0_10_35_21]